MWKATSGALVALLLCSCAPERRPYDRGAAYARQGDLDHAILEFTRAIKLKPDFAEAYGYRGYVYAQKGDDDRAIKDYTRAIELKPDYAESYGNRGIAYGRKGDYDRATQDYGRVIELRPDDAKTYSNRGLVYDQKGELDLAIEDFTRAVKLTPDDARAYGTRGFAYAKKGDWPRALADLTKATELGPSRPEFANNLAWLLATCPEDGVRDGAKALQYARKACELTKWQKPGCIDTLAAAYAEAGQYDEAVKWEKKALEDADYLKKYNEEASVRLKLYEAGKPYREAPPTPTGAASPDVSPKAPQTQNHTDRPTTNPPAQATESSRY